MNKQINLKVDIKDTTPVMSEDGNQVFTEAVIFRKVSRFLANTPEDGIIPIPCFIDNKTGKILIEMLPKEIREEYKEYNNNL
jgi:hypothetical protein